MSTIDTLSVITEAISQALETMAFLSVMPLEEDFEVPRQIVSAEIDFTGPICGTIRVSSGQEFARMLAENFSGDRDLAEEDCFDGMKELANVTCGLVLPMIAAREGDVFDLSVPHLTRSEEQLDWHEFVKEEHAAVLNVEGYPVAARLLVH